MTKTSKMPEKLTVRSRHFWYGLFYVLDQDKKKPAKGEEAIGIAFDNDYSIELDEKTVSIYETENSANKCSVKRNQEDDFPYCKLLDWYLKESVLNKNSR